jgi:hypothetical protein
VLARAFFHHQDWQNFDCGICGIHVWRTLRKMGLQQ